jgi:hypothetical protein
MDNNNLEQKKEELKPLQDYIFWLNSMTTTELCKEFGWPLPVFTGDIKTSADQFLNIDARLWNLVKEHNKDLIVKEHAKKLTNLKAESDHFPEVGKTITDSDLQTYFANHTHRHVMDSPALLPVMTRSEWMTGVKYFLDSEGKMRDKKVPFDFVVWYSGMESAKVQNAYNRYLREVGQSGNQRAIPDLDCGIYEQSDPVGTNKSAEIFVNNKLGDKNYTHSPYPMHREEIIQWLEEYRSQPNKDKITDKVYGFFYNPMIHESCSALVSLHTTQKGAEMAMEFHKAETKKGWEQNNKERKEKGDNYEYGEFGNMETWFVKEVGLIN